MSFTNFCTFSINEVLDCVWDDSAMTFYKGTESVVVLVVIEFEFDSFENPIIHHALDSSSSLMKKTLIPKTETCEQSCVRVT